VAAAARLRLLRRVATYPLGSKGGCYSDTLGKDMPDNACVQSEYDSRWYQCAGGSWVDRWTDPNDCDGAHAL
jgi:hypothetical protein